MAEPVLVVEKSEGIATLELNRPQAMNPLSRELRRAITEAFLALRDDPGIGVPLPDWIAVVCGCFARRKRSASTRSG